jgi:hypothetical protein
MFNLKILRIDEFLKQALEQKDLMSKLKIVDDIQSIKDEILFESRLRYPHNSIDTKEKVFTENEIEEKENEIEKIINKSEVIDETVILEISNVLGLEKNRQRALALIRKINFNKIIFSIKDSSALKGMLLGLYQTLKKLDLSFKDLSEEQKKILTEGTIGGYSVKSSLILGKLWDFFKLDEIIVPSNPDK